MSVITPRSAKQQFTWDLILIVVLSRGDPGGYRIASQ